MIFSFISLLETALTIKEVLTQYQGKIDIENEQQKLSGLAIVCSLFGVPPLTASIEINYSL